MFVSGLLAAMLAATPAIDAEAMKAGRLPLTGTVEEGDTCVMVGSFSMVLEILEIIPDLKQID